MTEYYDDFENEDFDDEPYENGLDEQFEAEPIYPDDEPGDLADPSEGESDEFTWKDAVILSGAMGWAYEEGYRDGRWHHRIRRIKKARP